MKKTIAIIILNWNGVKDTLECISSIKKNKFSDYKIFLVDNGSTDGSIEKFKKIRDKHINVTFHKNNLGIDPAYNLEVKKILKMGFKYIMILNNDVVVEKDLLSKLLETIDYNEEIGIVSPIVFDYYNKNNISEGDSPGRFNLKKGGGEPWFNNLQLFKPGGKSFFVDYACGACWLIRSSIISKTGFFNEKFFAYSEEIDLAIRIKENGYGFLLNPNARIWHKGAASSDKISGFKIYYNTRNMIWLEKIHSTQNEFLCFLLNLLFIKIPKNLFLTVRQNNKSNYLKSFFKGILEGLFTKKTKYSLPEFYKV